MKFPRQNNFDFIRLIAAIQVFVYHILNHFDLLEKNPLIPAVLNQFPGVPIFFFISGFLITASFNRPNTTFATFFRNRFLRIYPALWVCLFFTSFLLLIFGEIEWKNPKLYLWILGQMTFLQHYSPSIFESWGVGHTNGSLWSIIVELQFYLVLPFICLFLNNLKSKKQINWVLLGLFICFYLFNHIVHYLVNNPTSRFYLLDKPNELFYFRVLSITVFWTLYYFLIGIFFYYNFNILTKLIKGKFLIWLLIYMVYITFLLNIENRYSSPDTDDSSGFLQVILLAFLCFSFAFSYNNLSEKLLKGQDFSYGIYIYHMPIINAMLALNFKGTVQSILLTSIFVIILAVFSWNLVEKKAISLKNK